MNQTNTESTSSRHCLSPSAGSSDAWCFAGILDKLDDGVIVADNSNRTIVFCNAAADEILRTLGLNNDYDLLTRFLDKKNILYDPPPQQRQPHSIIHNNRIPSLQADAAI